jgi:hypothetical protein
MGFNRIDATVNAIVIWFVIRRKGNVLRWETFSAIRWLFGIKTLRADYIDFTARRYAKNARDALAAGYQPIDRCHLEELYWREELKKRI